MDYKHAPKAINTAARWLTLLVVFIVIFSLGFLLWMDSRNKQLSWSPLALFDKSPTQLPLKNNPVEESIPRKEKLDTKIVEMQGDKTQGSSEPKKPTVTKKDIKDETSSEPVEIVKEVAEKKTSEITADEITELKLSGAGKGSVKFTVPAHRSVSIQSTKNASFSQRYNVFKKSIGTDEWIHIESKEGSNLYIIPTQQTRSEYLITAENKDRAWKKSITKSVINTREQSKVRFEDDGFNIDAGSDYDLLLVLWMN